MGPWPCFNAGEPIMKPAMQDDQMPAASKYNTRNPSRVERLLRERELRKFNIVDSSDPSSNRGDPDLLLEREMGLIDLGPSEEVAVVGPASAAATAAGESCRGAEGRPLKQRVLVVANRLPVSAVRRGEDSWSLDVTSAGGLVSALLGGWSCYFLCCMMTFLFLDRLYLFRMEKFQ